MSLQQVLCELELLPTYRKDEERFCTAVQAKGNKDDEGRRMFLQGQFRFMEDWDAIIFLCNPM